jgi:hypothetical protein
MFVFHKISGTTPSAASTAAVLGTISDFGLDKYSTLTVVAQLVGATGGTLDVIVESSADGGTSWFEYGRFAQLAAGAAAVVKRAVPVLDNTVATIGRVTSGTATTSVLTGDTGWVGHWGDRLRVRCIAGAGTSAGAAIVLDFMFSGPSDPR